MVDQPGAIPMYVSDSITFDSTDATWIVCHKTAGFSTAQQVAEYFQAGSDGRNVSAHYVVGLDGTIVQCCSEARGAGANCCLEAGHADFLPTDINLNVKTISIEHVDPSTDNSMAMPPAQIAASFRLIHDICVRHNIPMRAGDASGGVIGHNDIAPESRARCPGPTYPWSELWAYLQGGNHMPVPAGWKDNGQEFVAKNGVTVTQGFYQHIKNAPSWDGDNVPFEAEYHADTVQLHAANFGGGQRQVFQRNVLWWTQQTGVVDEQFLGAEIHAAYQKIADQAAEIDKLQAEPAPAPVSPDVKAIAQKAVDDLQPLLK